MPQSDPVLSLIDHAVRAICGALHRHGIDKSLCVALARGLHQGDGLQVEQVFALIAAQLDQPELTERLLTFP